jgi:hypothetical protein
MEQITTEPPNEPSSEPGNLTIHFEGICTHILQGPTVPSLPVPRRIVLVHAEEGKCIHGHSIPPHRAFLKVDSLNIRTMNPSSTPFLVPQPDGNWQIKGARIRVNNPLSRSGDPNPDQPIQSMPSLKQLTPTLCGLSQEVVFGSDAACHFDVTAGTFSGRETGGGSFDAILKVTTKDSNPCLIIEDITAPPRTEPVRLTLNSGTTVTIANIGTLGAGDTPQDFLLHYLVLQCIPAHPGIPPEKFTRADFDGLGPGCSNSNYP